ncbi:MAG TPA: TetR/AcrR family transcriptional regulator [Microthrixaceae bacterium]|nr:TetR/AcrR family transcriptional regulator [Microthrixaceae bacterium]
MQPSAEAEIVTFPLLADDLPGPPPASLDPVLDATIECIARHGLSKTSLSDIARELGVAPSTVYRKVGTVENAAQLVMAREGHGLLERMPQVIAGVEGPRAITVFLAECIETTRRNPMVDKIMRDDDWVGRLATRRLEAALTRSAESSVPRLVRAMAAGYVRDQDPLALGHWIARITFACLLAPPPGDLLAALDAFLLPVLDPAFTPTEPKEHHRA